MFTLKKSLLLLFFLGIINVSLCEEEYVEIYSSPLTGSDQALKEKSHDHTNTSAPPISS